MTERGDDCTITDAEGDHPLVGQVLGERYRIEALLGEGGMGAVFRATHLSLERPVAVKVLHPRLTDDEHVSKRFDREALAVSKLDHPGCVQVIDFGTSRKGMKYLVMQFLDGRELRELTGVGLPVEQVVDFGVQILRALEHAHKRGLVHRDLKPENIFLVTDDEGKTIVKLVDFGIVKLVEATGLEKLTRKGMAFGTPTYMSPEQAAGGTIDPRTDLYTVGVLLYEMLTGIPPFDADEPGILLRMHILSDPPPLPDTVPEAMAAVVARLLEKEAEERYQTARDARLALAATLATPVSGSSVEDAVLGPDVPTEPAGISTVAERIEIVPTEAEAPEQTVAEPVLPVRSGSTLKGAEESESAPADPLFLARSGGTVVAGASASQAAIPGPMADASASQAAIPGPMADASVSHGAVHGSMAGASMSHGASSSPGVHYDPLMASSAHVPVTSGAYPATSGAYSAHSGAYGVPPPTAAPRPRSGRHNTTLLVVFLVLLTWGAIALLWLSSRNDQSATPAGATVPQPGVYRFTDGPADSEGSGGSESARGKEKKVKKKKDKNRGEG